MKRKVLTALPVILCAATAQAQTPDKILVNGRIFTGVPRRPYVAALAIRGTRIIAIGTTEEISARADAKTQRMDLGGRLVIPGINDAHYHLVVEPPLFSLRLKSMDPTWEEMKAELATAIAKAPKGRLLRGDIGATLLDDPRVTRASLDELAPNHPVILRSWTAHSAILNSAALRMLGVKEDEPDPAGGHYTRSPDGKLTGRVLEFAQFRLDDRFSEMTTEGQALQQVRSFFKAAVRFGITSVQSMASPVNAPRCIALFTKAPPPIRVRVIPFALTDQHGRIAQQRRGLPQHLTPLVTISGIKYILDGTPIERTSAMRQPYADRPTTSGELNFPPKELEAILRESLQNDEQLLVHISGDRATEAFLKAMEATGGKNTWANRRIRIEHGDGLLPDLVASAKQLGVIVAQNPTHLTRGELVLRRLGPERAAVFRPLRSLLEAGVPLVLASDAAGDEAALNPYLNIMLASTYPGKPGEAITREQAVTAFTLTAANAEFAENDKGSLEAGKLADLAVLSQDIFKVPLQELPKTESVLTMVGGKIVYDIKAVRATKR